MFIKHDSRAFSYVPIETAEKLKALSAQTDTPRVGCYGKRCKLLFEKHADARGKKRRGLGGRWAATGEADRRFNQREIYRADGNRPVFPSSFAAPA